jgi:hypothetical protein
VNSEIQLDAQDVIEILTAQRNAAMDEVARQGAYIKKISREMSELKKDYDITPK